MGQYHRNPNEIPSALADQYEPQHDYPAYSAAHPFDPIKGEDLSDDFTAIAYAIATSQDRLRLIQNDDGSLGNKTVGVEQVKQEAWSYFGIAGVAEWQPNTQYAINYGVWYERKLYRSKSDHGSGVTFDPSKWELIVDFDQWLDVAEAKAIAAEHWAEYPHGQDVPEGTPGQKSAHSWAADAGDDAAAAGSAASSASNSATAAAGSADNAAASEINAADSAASAAGDASAAQSYRDRAKEWAQKVGAKVAGVGWSAKEWAVGNTVPDGSAKYWAGQAGAAVGNPLHPLGTFDASTGSYPTSPTKGDWYRVSVEGTISGRDLKVDDKIYYDGTAWQWIPFSTAGGVIWETITGDKTFTNDDSGTTFYTSADAILTLPDYSTLDETWVIEIVCDDGPYTAHNLTLNIDGSDTIRNGITQLNGDSVIMVSANTGEFVVMQGPGELGTAAFKDAVGNVDNGSAIIESGSNANGSWTKWADGTMICRTSRDIGGDTGGANLIETWNFPQAFVNSYIQLSGSIDPFANTSGGVTGPADTAVVGPRFNVVSATKVVNVVVARIKGGTDFNTGDYVPTQMMAIGRWK